jgi:tyrosyl-tRNA synthetase
LTTRFSTSELGEIKSELKDPSQNPRDIKRQLARTLVTRYYSQEDADLAEQAFDKVFIQKEIPDDIREFIPDTDDTIVWIIKLIVDSGLAKTNSQARRLIKDGGIHLDEIKITDDNMEVSIEKPMILKAGKRRFVKITPKD